MQRVGDQREAAGKNAADHLDDGQQQVDADRQRDAPVARPRIDVMMVAVLCPCGMKSSFGNFPCRDNVSSG